MEFAFTGEAPIGSECRRVLLDEFAGAQARLAVFDENPDLTVHETRKHNKRIRGIFLLTRPILESGEISRANRLVRDAARRFSDARDALVKQETCDKLLDRYGRKRVGSLLAEVREVLQQRHDAILQDEAFPEEAKGASLDFAEAGLLVEAWNWDQVTLEVVFTAVVSNYRVGLRHYESSRASRDPHECHEWRKRAKYLSFHYQLLNFLDPANLGPRAALAEELASWLGEHHDIAVLEETLADHEGLGISAKSVQTLIRLCEERRRELERDAFERGAVVYLDRPEALHERFAASAAALA